MKRDMDFIYTSDHEEILIEHTQQRTRAGVISQYIRCRRELHMTQEELARRSGISRPNIARFESGNYNPSLEMMVRIAAALGMHLQISLEKASPL